MSLPTRLLGWLVRVVDRVLAGKSRKAKPITPITRAEAYERHPSATIIDEHGGVERR